MRAQVRFLIATLVSTFGSTLLLPGCGDPEPFDAAPGSSDASSRDGSNGVPSRNGSRLPVVDAGAAGLDGGGAAQDARARPDGSSATNTGGNPRHRWSLIQSGTFLMGSPSDERCRETDANARAGDHVLRETRHEVMLTRAFEMSANEVTLRQFEEVMDYRPPNSELSCTDDECPAAWVSWSEAAAYCNKLSAETEPSLTGCYDCRGSGSDVECEQSSSFSGSDFYDCPGYRLPTEAEFEYAYRAGSETAFYDQLDIERCSGEDRGLHNIAWYASNSRVNGERSSHPVGQKRPNAWGLYDMAGNVWNWCNDLGVYDLGEGTRTDPVGAQSSSRRIVRGGSYYYGPNYLRAATRNAKRESFRSPATGIRCVRTMSAR